MKYTITKEQFGTLSAEYQSDYKLDGDNATLIIEGGPVDLTDALETAEKKRLIEAEHRKNAEAKLTAATETSEQLAKDLKAAGGDKTEIARLTKAHTEEMEKLRDERKTEIAAHTKERHAAMIDKVAAEFATDRFTIPDVMKGPIAARLSVEDVSGTEVIRVLGADGKASALSLEELKTEFVDNSAYKSIVKEPTGSGSGAQKGSGQAGGGATKKKLSEMSGTEEVAFQRDDPAGYAKATAEEPLRV